ncbi:pyridoxal phosphate-dependent aminotransferase [Phreatobacter sp. AB_2022a]|uniref:pyridoxal phosphate-dependent aminotransferase n=1 Tax=Phreatobacter sp. AB_2022a TaxID=3003134 RepID=UPI002286EC5D|nr:aminotransferase class I/II-fold pyridoxal phosphate-dependent enzyme [Phreatobacter sp. AB_2022a]MCZ0733752.1 aminotransferase class I/II-fold pyridoxal phosphate-dependent enzyme [Phreatobacter sp. AB_2022a]
MSREGIARSLLTPARRGSVAPFLVMDVMTAAARAEAEGRSIIHMEVGEPGAATPATIREAAARALMDGQIGYTLALGMPELRRRIARYYADIHGVAVPIERIAVTMGSSSAFILSFLALFEAGDRVAIASPGYPAYKNILEALGCEVVFIETTAATRYAITPAMLAAEHAKKPLNGLLVASPANPTGTMMTPDALKALVAAARDLGIRFISDEIYHGLSYDMPCATALESADDVVVINSFSKYYCMTGWRIGWMVVPESLVRAVECLAQNLFISAPKLSQIAALAAFEATDALEAIKAGYAANRAVLLDGLPKAGLDRLLPVDGAFYVYADIGHLTNDSMDFARRMLAEAGVAATPGLDFDPFGGQHAIRFSFAGSTSDMEEAMRRLAGWLK